MVKGVQRGDGTGIQNCHNIPACYYSGFYPSSKYQKPIYKYYRPQSGNTVSPLYSMSYFIWTGLSLSLIDYSISLENYLRLYASLTGNEGPVKILYKCLLPIYVLPEKKLLFPKQNFYNVLSPSSYTIHSFICERFIYFRDRSAYSACCKEICGPIPGIYKLHTDT